MQNLVDSLCQCFGTHHPGSAHHPHGGVHPHYGGDATNEGEILTPAGSGNNKSDTPDTVPATPEMKRRTRSLKLQDEQWDALFAEGGGCVTLGANRRSSCCGPPEQPASSTTSEPPVANCKAAASIQAKAKLAAAAATSCKQSPTQPGPPVSHKRKRSTSRDDIFRKKNADGFNTSGGPSASSSSHNNSNSNQRSSPFATQANPFSRFLSNHPVIMNSLCFATPIQDPEDSAAESRNDVNNHNADSPKRPHNPKTTAEPTPDGHSVVSAAEDDTVTSTLYYETTKLAGLQQTNPPMPLFNHFAVEAQDDIHKIVASHSHSSSRMMDLFRHASDPHISRRRGPAPAQPLHPHSSQSHRHVLLEHVVEVDDVEDDIVERAVVCRQVTPPNDAAVGRQRPPRSSGPNRSSPPRHEVAGGSPPPPMTHCSSSGSSKSNCSNGHHGVR